MLVANAFTYANLSMTVIVVATAGHCALIHDGSNGHQPHTLTPLGAALSPFRVGRLSKGQQTQYVLT
jgi:hypothetical protein